MGAKPLGRVTKPPGGEAVERGTGFDLGRYCREIEAHLCARNDGRLIRIAGPTFDRVRGWAERGIPLTVVRRGIDRSAERYTARGQRRRPMLLDFCEADVLDVFDEWRRAVGVRHAAGASAAGAAGEMSEGESEEGGGKRAARSLPSHLERVAARLTALRTGPGVRPEWSAELGEIVRRVDAVRAGAKGLRGQPRLQALGLLEEIERLLLSAARRQLAVEELSALERQAAEDLRPFKARMPDEVFAKAAAAATDRLIRDRMGLPAIVP